MKTNLRNRRARVASLWLVAACSIAPGSVWAASLGSAKVSQVIQDVRVLEANAASRQAAINDNVAIGEAVRTGAQSRAELTFSDLTVTRLGENTIFSYNGQTRELNVEHGSVLLQVPPKSPTATIKTAAVTAAVTGGTAMFGTGPPTKFMVLEGLGTFSANAHPDQITTLHAGEMISLSSDGAASKAKFDVKKVLSTSHLIVDFPTPLANLPLILLVVDQQQAEFSSGPSNNLTQQKDVTDQTSLAVSAGSGGTPSSGGPPSDFGSPPTITTPDPYVIGSGTQINTDPTITTNGVTDFGKLYRGTAQDGSVTEFLFGEAPTAFDQLVLNGGQNHLPIAVFKFADLELTGDPTITVPSGATTNLALASVGAITSGAPGGTLTFAGIPRLDFITQNGSITLGSEISFSGIDHLTFYARGSGSNLTLASPISGGAVVHLSSEGTVQVNGNITVTDQFRSISGGDFLAGSGVITATNIDIESLSNINIDASKFPNPPDNTGSVNFNATNTLNLAINGGGVFGWDSLTATATTINVTSSTPTTFDFSNSSSVTFTAGTGGIQAPNIDFVGNGLSLTSSVGITVHSILGGSQGADAIISAGSSFSASGDVDASTLSAGTTVDVGGHVFVNDTLTAGGPINIGGYAVVLNINAPSSVLTVQQGIFPDTELDSGASLQHTFNVDSIVSPNGIDFNGNRFNGINGLSSGGRLTINANTLTFDSATGIASANFNGADSGAFGGGSPAEGGNGGVFVGNATGNITANNGADITATTGLNSATGVYSGAGGSVTLHSSGGMVTINNTIEVSSDGSKDQRQSASGGTILLQSDLTTGAGITVGSNGQLLSLLNANAPGPGGSITLSTMGSNIVVNGTIQADRGTITMDQNDPAGSTPTITIDGATVIANTLTINGAGDVSIGQNTAVVMDVSALSISAPGLITLNPANALDLSSVDLTSTGGGDLGYQSLDSMTLNGKARFETAVPSGATVSGADVTFILGNSDIGADFTNSSQTDFTRFQVTNQGHITTGGNISVNISGNLTATGLGSATAFPEPGDVELLIQNTNATIDNGGNATLSVGGNVNVNGLAVYINNYDETAHPAGHIGTGGNIDVEIGGDLTARSYVDVYLNNRGGGAIDSGGNLTFNVAGALIIGTDPGGFGLDGFSSEFVVESRFDDFSGNTSPSSIGSSATMFLHAASVDMAGDLFATGISDRGASINGDATATWDVTGDLTIRGTGGTGQNPEYWFILNDCPIGSQSQNLNVGGGTINGSATLTVNVGGDVNIAGDALFEIRNQRNSHFTAPNGGMIVGNATLNINAANLSVGGELDVDINNGNYGVGNGSGGSIEGNAAINVNVTGNLAMPGTDANSYGIPDAFFSIFNYRTASAGGTAGFIDGDASIMIQAGSIGSTSTPVDEIEADILNFNGGMINGNATVQLGATGNVTTNFLFGEIDNTSASGGTINGNALVNVNAGGDVTAASLFQADIVNDNGGMINGSATVQLGVTGNVNSPLVALISNSNGGVINGDASVVIQAGSIGSTATPAGDLSAEIDNYNGGTISGSATMQIGTNGDVSASSLSVTMSNSNAGSISGNAEISFDIGGTLVTQNAANVFLINSSGGQVIGNATVDVIASSGMNAGDGAFFAIINDDNATSGASGGTIEGDALVHVTADHLSTEAVTANDFNLFGTIHNSGGSIAGNASVTFDITNAITTAGNTSFDILNFDDGGANGGGTISGDASVTINAGSLSIGGDLLVKIINNGGTIDGNADITMNVGGTATVSGNATVQILGNDPVGSAAIVLNGGNYSVGGTFLSTIDGNGSITFTNATISADVFKAQVLGANGTLTIGGGSLSANTILKLYAPGSSGTIDFVANVTLSSGTAMYLAAKTITIEPTFTVSIAGAGGAANIYTDNPNYNFTPGVGYSGPPPNTSNGSFGGPNGANDPQPLGGQPGFGAATIATTASTTSASANAVAQNTGNASRTINLTNSGQLLSLLDGAGRTANGRVTVPTSNQTTANRSSNRTNTANTSGQNQPATNSRQSSAQSSSNPRNSQALANATLLRP